MSEEYDQEIIEQLKRSLEQLGQIYPVIRDYDGEILAGKHRLKAGATKIHDIDTRKIAERLKTTPKMVKLMIIMHSNVQRRMSREERRRILIEMAKELERMGVPKDQIASELYSKYVPDFSPQYILSLLPDEYKQAEKAVSPGRPKEETSASAEQKFVNLSLTGKGDFTKEKFGKGDFTKVEEPLPEVPVVKRTPDGHYEEVHGKEKAEVLEKLGIGVEKPKIPRTAEEIKEKMRAPISRMDLAVFEELQRMGVECEFQKQFCLQMTIADIYLPKQRVAIYLDGEQVHDMKREGRDKELRELLTKRYGIRVLSIPYRGFTKQELNRIIEEIRREVWERTSSP